MERRRDWPVVVALLTLAMFLTVNFAVFEPAARRFDRAAREAANMGLPLDGSPPRTLVPARVAKLFADNALAADVAAQREQSGELTSGLVDQATRLAGASGLQLLSAEPGTSTDVTGSVTVRAHLKTLGSYGSLVQFLDRAARSGQLLSVDRFTYLAHEGGRGEIELWVGRTVLVQKP